MADKKISQLVTANQLNWVEEFVIANWWANNKLTAWVVRNATWVESWLKLETVVWGTTFTVKAWVAYVRTVDVSWNVTVKKVIIPTDITWITASGLWVSNFTWITLDVNWAVQQYTSPPEVSVIEKEALLWEIVHFSWSATITAPWIVDTRAVSWKSDENISIWKTWTQKITWGDIDLTAWTALQFELAGGTYSALGRYLETDPNSPNAGSSPSVLYWGAGTLSTRTRSWVTPWTYIVEAQTQLVVNQIDDWDGTLSTVASGNFSNQYVYFFPGSNWLTVVPWRAQYTWETAALNALWVEETSAFDILPQAALIWAITVRWAETNLANAVFTPLSESQGNIVVWGWAGWWESNTASNVWTAWVGLYKQKVWTNLEFKNVNAWSSKITITDDVANNEVDIDVDPSQIATSTLNNDANFTPSDPTWVTGADQITNIMSLTTAEYWAITPNASTLYIITDA